MDETTDAIVDDFARRAAAAWASGALARAEQMARLGLSLDPERATLLAVLGAVRESEGRCAEAADIFRRVVSLTPDDAGAWHNLGVSLLGANQPLAAAASWRQALRLDDARADSTFNLARVEESHGNTEGARRLYERAANLAPTDARACSTLGGLLARAGSLSSAASWLREATRRAPDDARAWTNLGVVLRRLGSLADALRAQDRAVALAPNLAEAEWNRANLLLLLDRYEEGFAAYEARQRCPDWAFTDPPLPVWRGESLAGRTLLVGAEQGAGDMIQMARFFPTLARQGARVVVEAPAGLESLLADGEGVASVIPYGAAAHTTADYFVRAFSLPHRLGLRFADLPATSFPYVARPGGRPLRGETRVGICWSGNPLFPENAARSAPLEAFAPLAREPGLCLYSLQKGPPAADALDAPFALEDLAPLLTDYRATAAVMTTLDVIVTTDTSVAHLAGALGCRGYVLLSTQADWRWGTARETTPWYPSLHLVRQRTAGDWTFPIQEVLVDLREMGAAASTV